MKENGARNAEFGAEQFGFSGLDEVRWNWTEPQLLEAAAAANEGQFTSSGAFAVETGQHTGRSAKDKFVVRDDATDPVIWWDNNREMSQPHYDTLRADMLAHAAGRRLYAQDLYGGADPKNRLQVRLFVEHAWHALFIRHLLIRPDRGDLRGFVPQLTIVDLPSFRADPQRHGCRGETVIACDLSRGEILIGGTSYAGEMKKSVFTVLNYLLPARGVMPMHCSANAGDGGDVAVFFGLSGTGKTTLSADPARTLIGDDEHGWGSDGIFNFEGGCYAKTINLSEEAEPQIYATTKRFGTVLENVILDETSREPDFNDGRLTENTRCAYPLHYIDNASATGRAGHPANIVMLTCDAFGVIPPIAKLSPSQAMYHFLSGYTAKVAGTEKGVTEPEATFSTCFGAPFMPRHPSVYGNLLRDLIARHGVSCWLVNTGWTGGRYGEGRRMPISVTRGLLTAALDGSLRSVPMRTDPVFGFEVPIEVSGIDPAILDPRSTWADPAAYDAQARKLVAMFQANFDKFDSHVDPEVRAAAPDMQAAAE
ncbi:phosphoenolpyruvate carboxykinase [Microbaculum marinum]|uniref:Phosphoenolpyruvate carboxykinase (ATP) n=1 Tax=Microbaculum marinum TaxID=1764581 RepID=A0AAW9RT41_9HYPH